MGWAMRRVTVVLLASCLPWGCPTAAVAQESSAELVGIGGHQELPEKGFALTVPDGWVLVRLAEPLPDVLAELEAFWPGLHAIVKQRASTLDDRMVLVLVPREPKADPLAENCNVMSVPNPTPSLTIDDLVDVMTGTRGSELPS